MATEKNTGQKIKEFIIGAIILVVVVAFVRGMSGESENSIQKATESVPVQAAAPIKTFSKAQLDSALAAVKAEPKVLDAAWNNTSMPSLLAGVADDGSSRKGYAEYLCMVLAEHGIKGGVIRVMDVKEDWKELGKTWCPK